MELPLAYLTKQTTFERAVAENMFEGKPFGHANDDWFRLLAKRREGDELWYFAPPAPNSRRFWGLALVRGVRVISTVITAVD
jgi:hypothetical protein